MSDQQAAGGTGTRGEQAGAPIASEAPGGSLGNDPGSRAMADSADRRDVSETARDDVAGERDTVREAEEQTRGDGADEGDSGRHGSTAAGARDTEQRESDAPERASDESDSDPTAGTASVRDRSDDLDDTESAGNTPDVTTSRDADTADDRAGDDAADGAEDADRQRQAEEQRRADDARREQVQEEFAREHDPEKHDVSAGEEFRQEGDWTADDAGGPQVWDAEGNLVEGATPGGQQGHQGQQGQQTSSGDGDRRRTSSLDEVRDGGYGVGSAAPIDDGATPLGHPVKAWEDSKTYVTPEHHAYGDADPHLWFTDADAAERAGFRHVD